MQTLLFAAFSALRIYAILGRNIWWPMLIFAFGAVPIPTNLFLDIISSYDIEPDLSPGNVCSQFTSLSAAAVLAFSLATRLSGILADVLVLLLTWSKTRLVYKEAMQLGAPTPIGVSLLRDGTFYFLVLLVMNICVMLTNDLLRYGSTWQFEAWTPVAFTYYQVLPPILIARFLLNLRHAYGGIITTHFAMSAIDFHTSLAVGNLGEPLHCDTNLENPGSLYTDSLGEF